MWAHNEAGTLLGSAGSAGVSRRSAACRQQPATLLQEVECPRPPGTAQEWAMVRAAAVGTCAEAAFVGYARQSFGPWSVSAQRCGLPDARGRAVLLVTLLHGLQRQASWRAELDASAGIDRALLFEAAP